MDVSFTRCEDYDRSHVKASLARAVELLGGWGRFVTPGRRVVIKPNLLLPGSDRRPISTHVQVIRAVFEAVRDAGGDPVVFDVPGVGSLEGTARRLGFDDLPLMENRRTLRWRAALGPFGEIERVDLDGAAVVNVAKLKTHAMMGLTLATKHLFGLVSGAQRFEWHMKAGTNYDHFAGLLVEIERHVKPVLNILDAVVAMEGNGPAGGSPRPLGFLLASPDALSLDALVCRILGMEPLDLAVLGAAKRLAVPFDENPNVLGDEVTAHRVERFKFASDLRADPRRHFGVPGWRWLHELLRQWTINRPVLSRQACTGCKRCEAVCAARAVEMVDDKPTFDLAACIRCFCCQEMCPEGAITVRQGLLSRLAWRTRGARSPSS
ncbi:MAG: DUF362 domain-containing protein [Candidatus Riflebacteria bacterium]|nr:DUF362 domain-containing protein [Candidatus Riflebacteria bacterium]